MQTIFRYVFAVVASLFALVTNAGAQVLTYTFSQGGFDEGANITGSFSGVDGDGDGQLISFYGEIQSYAVSFSGNSLIPSFSHGFADLTGLAYEIGTPYIADGIRQPFGEGITSGTAVLDGFAYVAFSSGYRVFLNSLAGGPVSTTAELVAVSMVPEIHTYLQFLVGGMSILLLRSKRSAA